MSSDPLIIVSLAAALAPAGYAAFRLATAIVELRRPRDNETRPA